MDAEDLHEELKGFLKQNVLPALQEEDKYRKAFRAKVWLYFGILFFANSANVLIVLFNHLINGKSLSWEQLLLVMFCSVFALRYYIKKSIKNHSFPIFDEFVKFYNGWTNLPKEYVEINKDILPPHEKTLQSFCLTDTLQNNYELAALEFFKTCFRKKLRQTGTGILLNYTLSQKFNGQVFLFEKGGFFKQKTYNDLSKISSKVPASNYFYIFTDSEAAKNHIITAALFENLLNLRNEFHASKIYMQLTNSQISIFMQNGHLNYQERSVWHSAGTTEQFEKTNLQIEKTFTILGVIETLVETANEHV